LRDLNLLEYLKQFVLWTGRSSQRLGSLVAQIRPLLSLCFALKILEHIGVGKEQGWRVIKDSGRVQFGYLELGQCQIQFSSIESSPRHRDSQVDS
jgi:hypothetical protein